MDFHVSLFIGKGNLNRIRNLVNFIIEKSISNYEIDYFVKKTRVFKNGDKGGLFDGGEIDEVP